jgi:transcriptional regulator with GAF, ATPase, and Fis domain
MAPRASRTACTIHTLRDSARVQGHRPRFREAERQAIVHALESAGWRVSGRGGAADILGLKPTTLHAKMKKLGVHRPTGVVPMESPLGSA